MYMPTSLKPAAPVKPNLNRSIASFPGGCGDSSLLKALLTNVNSTNEGCKKI